MRTESDFIGEVNIPDEVLYGIHSVRARDNFPDKTPFFIDWYKSLALVKKACYFTVQKFYKAINEQYKSKKLPIKIIEDKKLEALIAAAEELELGNYYEHFIVPAISGGAGTSINLNINEIITNLALKKLNYNPGNYKIIDPIEDANIYQSTNDVIPTSLKITVLQLLNQLEEKINKTREVIEKNEKLHHSTLRIAYTQMQEAVPSSYGRLFSTYNEALSRDWWRVSKCFERIKIVNLGGSAIGSGITVPQFFIMEVVQELQKLTGLPITRSENMADATNNLDSFVEVHAILKSHAVNLEKMVNDLRLLSSDLINKKDIQIPKKQVGSSIMPGKVNPVIPEFIISCSHKIYSNDALIANLCAQGCLDLNAYLPIIGHSIIDSIKLLIACNETIRDNLWNEITINTAVSLQKLFSSASITTALLPYIGYNDSAELAKYMKENNCDVFEANKKLQKINDKRLNELLKTENLLNMGFRIQDIIEEDE